MKLLSQRFGVSRNSAYQLRETIGVFRTVSRLKDNYPASVFYRKILFPLVNEKIFLLVFLSSLGNSLTIATAAAGLMSRGEFERNYDRFTPEDKDRMLKLFYIN